MESWEVDGSALVVSGGGLLSILPFPEDADGEPANGILNLSLPGMGMQMPSEEEILNSTMDVNKDCIEFVTGGLDPSGSITFIDGVGRIGTTHGSSLSMTVWGFTVLNGRPVAIVNYYCYGGGTTGFDVVNAVDSDLEVVTSVPVGTRHSVWMRRPPAVDSIQVDGTKLVIDMSGFETVGDPISYVNAQNTLMWDGSDYVSVDWSYSLRSGRVVRPPDVQELQAIYDAVSDGKEDTVLHYFGDQAMMTHLDGTGFGGDGPYTARMALWAPGGKVEGCGLLPPRGEQLYDLGGSGLSTPPTDQYRYMKFAPGDFICGVTNSEIGTGTGYFSIWWIVTTDEDGAIMNIEQGRNFA